MLGLSRSASSADIRRAYLSRSKICHPDRNKHEKANEAFQRLGNAYQTLSKPESRQLYDLYGQRVDGTDQTFADAVSQVFSEFLAGQFDTLIRMVDHIQSLNPEVKINRDHARRVFSSVREFFLWSGDCWGAARFEVIRLYEMEQKLTQLSYFDVLGRWQLAGRLSSGILHLFGTIVRVAMSGRGPVVDAASAAAAAPDDDGISRDATAAVPTSSSASMTQETCAASTVEFYL